MKINPWKASTFVLAAALGVTVGTSAIHSAYAASASAMPKSISEKQPHMVNARKMLQDARAELVLADEDKGGHRKNAIGDIDLALSQVEQGIAFANGK